MRTCKWGDICTLEYGKALREYPTEPSEEMPFRVFGTNGPVGWTAKSLSDGPGVIVGRKGAYRGIHFSSVPFFVIDTAYYLRPLNDSLDLKWAYYKLLTVDINRIDVGAAIPTTSRNAFYTVPVKIPSLETQKSIAPLLGAYDDLIENNRRRMALLEESARLLYREWFISARFPGHEHTRIVNGIPEGWTRGCVSDFYNTASGGTPSRTNPDFFNGNIPWVKTQELLNGFITETEEKITEDAVKRSSAKIFPERTLLVAMYGATIGQIGVLATPAASNQACCAIIPKDPRASFLHAFLFFRENKERLVGLGMGAAQNNINQQIIRSYPMSMPSLRLAEVFSGLVMPLFDQWLNLHLQSAKLQAARELLLPRLMSGDIAV